MVALGRSLRAAMVSVLAAGLLLVGCQGPGEPAGPAKTAASHPASAPASQPALSAKALVHLEAMTPAIEKPANPATAPEIPARAQPLVTDALKLIASRDYAGAVNVLERAVGYDPENPKIRRVLAFAYAGLHDRGRAEDNIRRSLKTMPDDLESQLLLGELFISGKQNDQAILALRTAMKCSNAKAEESLAAEALLRLCEVLEREDYLAAAAEGYTQLGEWLDQHGSNYGQRAALRQLMLRPEHLLARRGAILMHLNRPAEAIDLLDRAYNRDRTDVATATLLVQSLVNTGAYPKAEKLVLEMMAEPVQRRQTPMLIETMMQASGDVKLPTRLWQAALAKRHIDEPLGMALASLAERSSSPAEAVVILNSLLENMPDSAQAARTLTLLYGRLGKGQEGLDYLVRALAANPSSYESITEAMNAVASGLPAGFEKTYAAQPGDNASEAFAFHYVAAKLAQLRGQGALAMAQYQLSLDARKDFAPALEGLLEAYLDQNKVAEAAALVQALPNANGFFAEYAKGRLLQAQGKTADALAALNRARAANGRHLPTLLALADIYSRRGQTTDAKDVLKAAVDASGKRVDVYRRLVDLLVTRREFNEAVQLMADLQRDAHGDAKVEALAADFKFIQEVGNQRGIVSKAEYDRSCQRLGEMIKNNPQDSEAARQFLAELQIRVGHYEAALETLRPVFEEGRVNDSSRLYVEALIRLQKWAPAADALEKLLQSDSQDAALRLVLLDVLDKLKQYDRAATLTRDWLAKTVKESDKFTLRVRLMGFFENAGKFDESLQTLESLAAEAPGGDVARRSFQQERIRLMVVAKRYDEVAKQVQQLVDADPQDPQPRQALIRAMAQNKLYDEAIKMVDGWLAADANNDSLRPLKLLVYQEANQVAIGQDFARKWIAEMPADEMPRQYLVSAMAEEKKYDEAIALLDKWLAEAGPPAPAATEKPASAPDKPHGPPTTTSAPASKPASAPATQPASAPTTQPATAPALKLPRPVIRNPLRRPRQPQVVQPQGETPGLSEEALAWCRQTIVRLLIMKQDYATALKRAEGFLADPNNPATAGDPEMLNLKSTILSEQGNRKEALSVLEEVNNRFPDDPSTQNNLGYAYADLGIQLDKAEQLIRSAVGARPDVAFVDSLGWILYKRGQLRDAAAVFDLVLRQENPDKPLPAVILDHSADTFARLGWLERSGPLWKRSLEQAQKEKILNVEIRDVKANVPKKLAAMEAKQAPPVAPLGEGVKEDANK